MCNIYRYSTWKGGIFIGERSERDSIRGVQIRAGSVYVYIYVWRYVCHNSSACHVYIMWAELGHSHFLYVPAVSNVVTNGNGRGTKNVLKGTVHLGLSLVSSLWRPEVWRMTSCPIPLLSLLCSSTSDTELPHLFPRDLRYLPSPSVRLSEVSAAATREWKFALVYL